MTNTGIFRHGLFSAMRSVAIASAVSGLTVGLSPLAASASLFRGNDYEACTESLIDDGISVENAAAACAGALDPRDISTCVDRILDGTDVTAVDALDSCIQVRRPREMASCVVMIDDDLDGAIAGNILEYCTRSLLPKDYADCVTGIDSATDLEASAVMETCIDADYVLPAILYPNFVFIDDVDDVDIDAPTGIDAPSVDE